MSKIGQIFEGWKNHLLPADSLKEKIDEVSEERLAICRACPLHSSNKEGYKSMRKDEHCTECGCSLLPKTKCLSCECPVDKWGPELTAEQEKEIQDGTRL